MMKSLLFTLLGIFVLGTATVGAEEKAAVPKDGDTPKTIGDSERG